MTLCTSSYQVVKNWSRDFNREESLVNTHQVLVRRKQPYERKYYLVYDVVLSDRRVTARFIVEKCGLSIGTVEKILHDELRLKKISAGWASETLTVRRHVLAETNLELINRDPDEFLTNVFTAKETWVHHYDPE
jgi:hypothetical protein